ETPADDREVKARVLQLFREVGVVLDDAGLGIVGRLDTLEDRNKCVLVGLGEDQLELTFSVLIVVEEIPVPNLPRREAIPRFTFTVRKLLKPRRESSKDERHCRDPLLTVNDQVGLSRRVRGLGLSNVYD